MVTNDIIVEYATDDFGGITLACEGTPVDEPDGCCPWESEAFPPGTRLNTLIAAAEEHVTGAHR